MATVSHVINETRYVSDELIDRVKKAMIEMDYHLNLVAGSLRKHKTNSIGIIIPNNANPLFSMIGKIVENKGFENNYSVLLCNSEEDIEKEIKYINTLWAKRVDGLIIIPSTSESSHIDNLIKNNRPVIIMDRKVPNSMADSILINNFQAVFDSTEYLINLDHRCIAYIDRGIKLPHSRDRLLGYMKALEKYGIKSGNGLIVNGGSTCQDGEIAMKKILSFSPIPTAVIAYNDLMAIGALRAIKDFGLSVPENISLVGFDDIVMASYAIPRLTTVHFPVKKIANYAFDLLMERINNKMMNFEKKEIILNLKLVIRESSSKRTNI